MVSLPVKILLTFFVVTVHAAANFLFFARYGPYASAGADIWFFVGVAKGYYHLFWADALGWLLFPLRACSPETVFTLLLALSNGLHFLTLFLMFRTVREVYRNERAACWTAVIFSCSSSALLYSTGTFVHQQASLPLMVALVWTVYCYLTRPAQERRRWIVWSSALAIIGLGIGPDLIVWLLTGLLALAAWHWRRRGISPGRLLAATGVVAVIAIALVGLRPVLEHLAIALASLTRGIDLSAQRAIHAGDLMPLSWSRFTGTYPLLGYGLIALALYAWCRGRVVEGVLVLVPSLFSLSIVRFFFLAELGLAFLIGWFFARGFPSRAWLQHVAGLVLVVLLLMTAVARGFTCLCPSALVRTLVQLRNDPAPKKIVVCTPSYGFVVKALTGEQPTADMHRLNSNAFWMESLSRPADEASYPMRERGATHVLLTSNDFCETVERGPDGRPSMGTYCSGGLEKTLLPLPPDDLRFTFVYRALAANFPISHAHLLFTATDPVTRLRVVLYRLQ
jgi:MFS family permease